MDSITIQNKKYLNQKVNPILELLIAALMKRRPEDPIKFMKNWLSTKGLEMEEKIRIRDNMKPEGIPTTSESEMDEDEEMDDYDVEQENLLLVRKGNTKNMRSSVSAEVYGDYNKKGDFKAPVIPKSEEVKQQIIKILNNSFLFNHLEEKEKNVVALAMKKVEVPSGEYIIKQGDDGNDLYVVESGNLSCSRKPSKDAEDQFLLNYGTGDAFGELALLYNAPRAASIKATSNTVLWALDRETFNHIVKDAVIKRREQYENFLGKIELLDSLTFDEKNKICDCLKIERFKKGEYVIREGESGNTFYLIKEGTAVATKGKQEEVVFKYKENDYFGELALLREEPRAANIQATSDLVVASIDRSSFKRLLGPLEEILKRNTARYENFVVNS
jgi:cAMP-dependent protein kinase regulator